MPRNPFVSVIVLNWNGRECIEQCLKSLLNQTYQKCEIIVVDNASSDGSQKIVRKEFPNVKLIVNDRNLGFAKGNNIGIKIAKGDLIALFNYDAVADQNWLLELVDAIMKSKTTGVVGGPIYYLKPKDVIWAARGKIDALTGLDWHPYQGEKLDEHYFRHTNDVDFIPGCALLIKREVIDKIGLLDEDYFLYFDDLDWGLTAKRAGYACRFVPPAIVYHLVSFGLRKKPLLGYYHQMRSRFHLYLKHFPTPFVITSLFFQVIFTFFEILWFKRSVMYAKVKLHALIWNMHNLKKILEKRKHVGKIGRPCYKIRFLELLKTVKKRIISRQYYW